MNNQTATKTGPGFDASDRLFCPYAVAYEEYYDKGWSPFPIRAKSKNPLSATPAFHGADAVEVPEWVRKIYAGAPTILGFEAGTLHSSMSIHILTKMGK